MSIAINITIDEATPVVGGLIRAVNPDVLNPVLGRACVSLQREHLFGLNQSRANALGGKRTNFFGAAARATSMEVRGNGFFAGTSHVGMRLHYSGGTVRPKSGEFLTIPARAEAHGKRAREFHDLKFAFVLGRPALVQADQTALVKSRRKATRGNLVSDGEVGGLVMYWLVRKATIKADPSVMPSEEQYAGAMEREGREFITRAAGRAQS